MVDSWIVVIVEPWYACYSEWQADCGVEPEGKLEGEYDTEEAAIIIQSRYSKGTTVRVKVK